MHRSLFALPIVLVACGSSSASDPPAAPPPSDPIVYDASDATRGDVGVAKWGYGTDASTGESVFHGYDAHNAQIVEIKQSLSSVDAHTARSSLTMSGVATASETIEFAAKPADGDKLEVSMVVIENSFADGSEAARILAHLGDDAKNPAAAGAAAGPLTQSHPLDNSLVSHGCDTVTPCLNQIIDARVAVTSQAGSCSLFKLLGQPLINGVVGAGVGGLITLETGPGAVVGAVAGGVSGVSGTVINNAISCATATRDASKATQAVADCKKTAAASCGK